MDVFAQTDNSLDLINTEKGFRTSLFGFARAEVLEFIDQLMSNNAARNSQLNSSLVDMEAKVTDLKDENEALLDKTRVLVDQLEEKRSNHIQTTKDIEELKNDLKNKTEEVEQLKERLFSQEQEHNLSLSEIASLRKQIASLEDRLLAAKESSKCADDTIVAAQRAATRIMTEAVKQSPKNNNEFDVADISSIRDKVRSLENQLRSISDTVEIAFTSKIKNQESMNDGYYRHTSSFDKQDYGVNGGWISASIPQPNIEKNVSYWQPLERPTTPVGWQSAESAYENDLDALDNHDLHNHSKEASVARVYHHRRADTEQQERMVKVVKPTAVNYSQLRRQHNIKYIVTPHKR